MLPTTDTGRTNLPPTNPFSSQAVTPGAIPYIHDAGEDLEELVAKFQAAGYRGQIVGPHGSGKSTLLASLLPRLRELGHHVESIALHDGERRLPHDFATTKHEPPTIVVIDGYEQLSWFARRRIHSRCRRYDWGLLAVVHESVGLPTLCAPRVSTELAAHIVKDLLQDRDFSVPAEDLEDLLGKHAGNLRDVLFDLYDRYERVR